MHMVGAQQLREHATQPPHDFGHGGIDLCGYSHCQPRNSSWLTTHGQSAAKGSGRVGCVVLLHDDGDVLDDRRSHSTQS
jgi:hypothetical protein